MAGITIGRKYLIVKSGQRYELPYAGEIGTLISIVGKQYEFDFTKKKKITCATDIERCSYFLGDFTEVDRYAEK